MERGREQSKHDSAMHGARVNENLLRRERCFRIIKEDDAPESAPGKIRMLLGQMI